jgi:aspartate aminotransferase/aminotransferase
MRRSGIRVILDMALRIPDAIHLEIGQPDFPTPAHIVEAAHQAMRQGFTKYTANAGLLSLREAIAAKARRDNGIQASADDVVVTTGGMGGLFSAAAAVLDPGDEVLAPDPGYPNYEMMATLCHATTVRYPLTGMADGFQPDLDALPALVTPRAKAIIVNSPGNPTGSVISADALAAIVAFAQRHDLFVISDECYEKILFGGAMHVSPAALNGDGRVITVSSFSKTYAMTGWRIGYAIARAPVAATLSKLQEATVACASSVSQKAAEAALAGPRLRAPARPGAGHPARARPAGLHAAGRLLPADRHRRERPGRGAVRARAAVRQEGGRGARLDLRSARRPLHSHLDRHRRRCATRGPRACVRLHRGAFVDVDVDVDVVVDGITPCHLSNSTTRSPSSPGPPKASGAASRRASPRPARTSSSPISTPRRCPPPPAPWKRTTGAR